jgi:WD40 repeat protein/tRNA A-37 threonylcarbamoyl transferase component Bud32
MHLLCPHCQNPIELIDETPSEEVVCPSCGSSFHLASGSLQQGTISHDWGSRHLGRFELLQLLGTGAFGTVWKARDPQLDRTIALKIPRTGNLGTQADRDRFLREARAAAQLRHDSIVAVHEVGEHDGQPYIVSDFVDGIDIAEWLSAKKPTFREAAAWVADVADALQYAHDRGVIHRDIKPSNLILDAGGRLHVMDFGLAKRDAGEITMTHDGQILGTPAYMAPEQIEKAHQVDGRADVYALGVVLYRLLTGELPFRGTTRMLLHQVLHEEPRPPRKLNDRIPRDLETICLKAMAKEPGRRYATARELAADLGRFLGGEPIRARRVGAVERYLRWARRHPGIAILGGGLTAVLVLATFASVLVARRMAALAQANERAAQSERGAKLTALAALNQADQQRDMAEQRLYDARMNFVQRYWEDYNGGSLQQGLDEQLPANQGGVDRRGFEWFYWQRKFSSGHITLKGHTNLVSSVAFSPDGTRLASASADRTVKLWDVGTGQEIRTLKGHTQAVSSVAFSPDGHRLASGGQFSNEPGEVKVWDAATGQEIRTLLTGHTQPVTSVAFSPDGRRLASAGLEGTVKLWDAATGQEIRTLNGDTGSLNCVAFSPDGRRLASAGWAWLVKVWDAATGQEIHTLKGHTGITFSVAFSPDGTRLASASTDRTVKVWNAATGQETLTLKGHTEWVQSVVFSPDGTRLASASRDQTVKVWDAKTGQETLTLKGHTGPISSVAFSPDGRRLASASQDQTVKLWDVGTGQETLTLKGRHIEQVLSVVFSPDGTRLASPDWETVKVWDTATGQEILTLKGPTPYLSVAFSPDGTRLASADIMGTVKVWNAATGQETRILKGHTDPVRSVAFSPDATRLASAGQDGTVKVWDAATGQETLTLKGHTQPLTSVAFSPDGTRLASPDWETVKVWDTATGQEILTLKGPTPYLSVAFSPDGRRLASASADQPVKVWDAATGREILTLKGHTDRVESVAFSPDGQRLASASADGTVKIWDATPITPESLARDDALRLIRLLLERVTSEAELRDLIAGDSTISKETRATALNLAEGSWARWVRGQSAEALNHAAWELVKLPNRPEADSRRGLRLAEAACRLEPNNGVYLNTLGVAQYHTGQYEEAQATLTRSNQLNGNRQPADLAFLAMTQHRLNQGEAARATLQRLRELMKVPEIAANAENQGFLREAETVILNSPELPEEVFAP